MHLVINEDVIEVNEKEREAWTFFENMFKGLENNFGQEEIVVKSADFLSLSGNMAKAEFVLWEKVSCRKLLVLLERSLTGVKSLEKKDFCQTGLEGCLEYSRGESVLLILFTNASAFNGKIYLNCSIY